MAKKNSRKGPKDPNNNVVATNRRARHDYNILDRYEAGMVLTGTEVKSLREGQASLTDGFAAFSSGGELWLEQVHIPEYLNGTWTNHSARRKRKLLLHHKELVKITRRSSRRATRSSLSSCTSRMAARRSRSASPRASASSTSARRCVASRTSATPSAPCAIATAAPPEALLSATHRVR